MCSVSVGVLEVGATSHCGNGVVGTVGHRRGSPAHLFSKMHRITQSKVDILVGRFFEIMCSVSAGVLEVGTTSHCGNGVVGMVGHRKGSPAHSSTSRERLILVTFHLLCLVFGAAKLTFWWGSFQKYVHRVGGYSRGGQCGHNLTWSGWRRWNRGTL